MICQWSPCSVLVILLSEKFTAKAQTVGVGRQCPQRQVFLSFFAPLRLGVLAVQIAASMFTNTQGGHYQYTILSEKLSRKRSVRPRRSGRRLTEPY